MAVETHYPATLKILENVMFVLYGDIAIAREKHVCVLSYKMKEKTVENSLTTPTVRTHSNILNKD